MSVNLSAFLSPTMTETTVYVIQGQNKHKTCYHHGPDACQSSKAANQFEEVTKTEAHSRGFRECRWCAGDVDTSGKDMSYQNALKQAAKANAGGD